MWKKQMDETMQQAIGLAPVMMRAPGGLDTPYIHAGVNMPVVHWSRISGDSNGTDYINSNYSLIVRRVAYSQDGEIVLCHDLTNYAGRLAADYLPVLKERNVLCVTILDMFAIRNRPMPLDTAINDCLP